jgi:Domain of unknown function (DUF4351)
MLKELISYRFGGLEPSLMERVLGLKEAEKNALAKALFDFQSLADLVGWLDQLP